MYYRSAVVVALIAATALLFYLRKDDPPQSLEDARRIAVKKGFFVVGDTISRTELTRDEANVKLDYVGCVRVIQNAFEEVDAPNATVWGKVLLFGDSKIIKELTQ